MFRISHKPNSILYLPGLLFLAILSGCQTPTETETPAKPNIILIMADDLGYADLGAYGQKRIKTPVLDKMAADGLRFTDFYSGATVCAPSRGVLMTGLHTGHSYIRGNDPPGSTLRFGSGLPLRESDSVMSQYLKEAGYVTGMFGKWGLGVEGTTGGPHVKGWDHFYGFLNQADAHKYYFHTLWEVSSGTLESVPIDTTFYTHELIMDKAFSFIKENSDSTFFLYLPVAIPHAELKLPEEDMTPYLDDEGNSIFEEENFEGSGLYSAQDKPAATYAAMVSRMDRDIGKLLEILKEQGIDDNTYIFFTSDNGPHSEGGIHPEMHNSNGPLRGLKRDLYEGGIRVPLLIMGPGVPQGKIVESPYAAWDLLPTFSEIVGIEPPKDIDGISFYPLLSGREAPEHHHLYWEHFTPWENKFQQAVRMGPWKGIRYNREDSAVVTELYHLGNDIGEQRNLADSLPDKLDELVRLMDASSEPPEAEGFRNAEDFFGTK